MAYWFHLCPRKAKHFTLWGIHQRYIIFSFASIFMSNASIVMKNFDSCVVYNLQNGHVKSLRFFFEWIYLKLEFSFLSFLLHFRSLQVLVLVIDKATEIWYHLSRWWSFSSQLCIGSSQVLYEVYNYIKYLKGEAITLW